MKKILVIIAFIFVTNGVFGQKSNFTKGDNGKYIYYEVVVDSVVAKAELVDKIVSFLRANKLKKQRYTDTAVVATGNFVVNKSGGAISHPAASVGYTLNFQCKEGKYRFWLTDFFVTLYERDRYGNFVPTKLQPKALEAEVGKLNQAQWNEYVKQLETKSISFASQLKAYLARTSLSPKKIDVKNRQDW